jgi:hypothetical protein
VKLSLTHVLLIVLLALGIVAFFLIVRSASSPAEEPAIEVPEDGGASAECPIATPEFFTVEPVTSPTDQLSQIITVDLGNGEAITITAESGTFAAPFDTFPKEVEITLLPNTIHNLTVEGKVREVTQGECVYGGYTLSTTTARDGSPLVIEQRE